VFAQKAWAFYISQVSVKALSQIQKLKELFDHSSAELRTDYWTPELLQLYSETLGERILWKWQAFLEDLKSTYRHPEFLFKDSSLKITDWGCGPGTASFAFAKSCSNGPHNFNFFDRSQVAMNFAQKRLSDYSHTDSKLEAPSLLLISYVLSELPKEEENKLLEKICAADAFMWVDAGTYKESRRLSKIRNTLLSHFDFLAPCPHSAKCPLSDDAHPHDWCHRFAKAPQEVFHSSKWSTLANELKIDLRSLPYASLYGVKKKFSDQTATIDHKEVRIGSPRVGKHEITVDFCTPEAEYVRRKVTKRANPELFKKLRKE